MRKLRLKTVRPARGAASTTALLLSCATLFVGCDDNTRPSPPSLGVQIDRMGRAGVNTALTAPFEAVDVHDRIQDEYNLASNPDQWNGLFGAAIQKNLAILDGLDRSCGNQLLAASGAPRAGRYAALASVLADDKLYVNTASGSCQIYLAVEGNALGITNADCGGRTPLEDTIDVTYSVLAIGALSGVNDGVARDGDGTASLNLFPFLDQPN